MIKGMRTLQQMEELGRPIGTIIQSKPSRHSFYHSRSQIVFFALTRHETMRFMATLRALHRLVTSIAFATAFSTTLQKCIVFSKEAFVSIFDAL